MTIDPKHARLVKELAHERPFGACAFDRTGRWLFAGEEGNRVCRWDVESGRLAILKGHGSWVRSFAFPPGEQLVTAGYDGRIIWWPLADEVPLPTRTLQAHQGWVRAMALSADGQLLATCGNDHLVKIWSASDGTLVAQLAGHTHQVYSVAFHPREGHVVSADHLGVVRQWDPASWTEVRQHDARQARASNSNNLGTAGGLRKLAFSADGTRLGGCGIIGGEDPLGQNVLPGALIFDWGSGQATLLRGKAEELGVAWGLVHHPTVDVWTAVAGGLGAKHLYFWSQGQERPSHVVDLPSAGRDLALHPDLDRMAVAHHDRHLRIYSLQES